MNREDKFKKEILKLWKYNRRDYPWRKTSDPYKILITEILLRKTTATHVNSIYKEFFNKYPNLESLFSTDPESLKEMIIPLGLANQRTNQIISLTKTLIDDFEGEIPNTYQNLLKLPGVGRYTAGAVMCVSFNSDEAMVDTNAVRVIGRYFNFKSSKKTPYTDPELWVFVKNLIPKGKCKEFNLGIIDFANAVCLPKIPKCNICNLNEKCNFYNQNCD